MSTVKPMLILIAGPVRSGTHGDEALIKQNLENMQKVALSVYQRGHIPVISEWLALPLAETAGSKKIGDEISETFLYPVAHRLLARCDGIIRIAGESKGADNDMLLARELGLTCFASLEAIPEV
ncbi:NUDIX hydrolase [Erwinia sp.]|uniref:NUDIX hydrolase n=1 Tax=Erwinia citreus TaxID=558 RepID=UPI003C778806